MSLALKNTRDLVKPENFKAKILVYAMPGSGKTTFLGTAKDVLIGACETGEGSGLLPLADKGINYTQLSSYDDFGVFCSGAFTKKVEAEGTKVDVLGLDSLSDMARTFIKDKALSFPRKQGDSQKRHAGVPELDDYGVIAELTRRHLRMLIEQGKHVVVTALMKFDKADPEKGETDSWIGPDLAGQMFLGAPAMFDLVLCLRSEKGAKGRIRYFITDTEGSYIAKCRPSLVNVQLLDKREPFNLETGEGTFPRLMEKILTKYETFYKSVGGVVRS